MFGGLGDAAHGAASAAASGAAEAAAQFPWWEVFHGLNILINSGLIFMDGKKFYDLYKMRRDWGEGGEERQELLKNSKFEKEVTMRDLIRKIRDSINSDGY